MKLSQRIKLRSSNDEASMRGRQEDTKFFHKIFPFFIWLLRDVTQSIPPDCKDIKEYFLTKVRSKFNYISNVVVVLLLLLLLLLTIRLPVVLGVVNIVFVYFSYCVVVVVVVFVVYCLLLFCADTADYFRKGIKHQETKEVI